MYKAAWNDIEVSQNGFESDKPIRQVCGPMPGSSNGYPPGNGSAYPATIAIDEVFGARSFRAWACALRMKNHEASTRLSDIRKEASKLVSCSREPATLRLLEAFLQLCSDDGNGAERCALPILNQTNDPWVAYAVAVICRIAAWMDGDLSAPLATAGRSPPTDQNLRTSLVTLVDRAVEAATEMRQLRLSMAARLSRAVIEGAPAGERASRITIIPRIVLAQLAYENGDFVEADSAVRAVLPGIRSTFTAEPAIAAYVTLARSAIRRGRSEFASVMLQEGDALGRERGWPRLTAACLAERVDLLMVLGREVEAATVFDRLETLYRGGEQGMLSCVAFDYELASCRRLAAAGSPKQEMLLLTSLLSTARARGDALLAVRLSLRLAAASARLGDDGLAAEIIRGVIRSACESGLYQTILDAGDEVKRLLIAVQDSLPERYLRTYVTTLLAQWPQPPTDNISKGGSDYGAIITCRERAVLHLMSLGQSNKLIAKRLGIAPETVKSHAKNIFLRLGSGSRTEAVSRAASLGMI